MSLQNPKNWFTWSQTLSLLCEMDLSLKLNLPTQFLNIQLFYYEGPHNESRTLSNVTLELIVKFIINPHS